MTADMTTRASSAASSTASSTAASSTASTAAVVSRGLVEVWTTDLDDAPVAAVVVPPLTGTRSGRDDGSTGDGGPGARVVIAGADGLLVLLEVDTGQVLGSAHAPGGLLDVAVAPGPGRTAIAMAGPRGHGIWLPDHPDGGLRWQPTRRWSARLAWNGAGQLAVASGKHVEVTDRDLAEVWSSPAHAGTVTDLCWMDSGRRIAATSYGGVTVHRPGRSDPAARYSYLGSHLVIAVPAGERWVVTGNQDATIHLWRRVANRDGGDELHMSGYPNKISRLAFDPTGRWLAADGAPEITVWDFAGRGPGGRSPRFLPGHDQITAFAWSPHRAALLATGGSEGRTALWEPGRGKPGKGQRPLLTHGPAHPDGPAHSDVDQARSGGAGAVMTLTWVGPDRLLVGNDHGRLSLLRIVPDPGAADR